VEIGDESSPRHLLQGGDGEVEGGGDSTAHLDGWLGRYRGYRVREVDAEARERPGQALPGRQSSGLHPAVRPDIAHGLENSPGTDHTQ
jgi:hypothetical protein